MALGQLENPPIFEVVCGVLFDEVPALDPLQVGLFWGKYPERYASHELHPPIRDEAGLQAFAGVGPVRSWLVGQTGEYVLQVQPDRLYFNWRRRGNTYPRFNTYDQPGVLDRLLEELALVKSFCLTNLKSALEVRSIELAKIDMIDFGDFDELERLVPAMKAARGLAQSALPEVRLLLRETVGDVTLRTHLSTALSTDLVPTLRCDILARKHLAPDGDLREDFRGLNAVLNGTFERLLSDEALERFSKPASPQA
ncbi:MAG: TIGR04255 family protein [Polyangiaceae bacterium]